MCGNILIVDADSMMACVTGFMCYYFLKINNEYYKSTKSYMDVSYMDVTFFCIIRFQYCKSGDKKSGSQTRTALKTIEFVLLLP